MTCDLCAEPGAVEWLSGLDPSSDEPVLEAIDRVEREADRLDETAAAQALVAGELVASAAGEAPDELPAMAREWVERHGVPAAELVERALHAVRRVAIDETLRQEHDEAWLEAVHDLRYRLGDVAAP